MCCTWALYSQNIQTQTLTWKVDGFRDLSLGSDFPYTCSFVTQGNTVQWKQASQEVSYDITIETTTGSWGNIALPGEFEINGLLDGKQVKMKFERNSEGVFITLQLTDTETSSINHRYHVSEVN